MKKKKKQEIKDVYIDADHILYAIASPPSLAWRSKLSGKSIVADKVDVKKLKKSFNDIIDGYTKTAEVESIANDYTIGKTVVVISDASNFRYDIFPEYKHNRRGKESTKGFIKLRKWARKKFAPKQNIEADDMVSYYVSRGAIGFSADKDLLKGVEGTWFDCYHTRRHWVYTGKLYANEFNLIQYVAGDAGDGIVGIDGVAEITARKLLDKFGWDWNGVVQSYYSKGHTKGDAILTRQLVSMEQWTPKKGVKLFKSEKIK